jgi:uncharacterized protein YjbI with pentapeptide repeats
VEEEPQPRERIAGDRLLKSLGIDPNKWTVGDRRIVLLGIGIGLSIVIIAVCGYAFGWAWTGLTEPKQRTFWDWLSLLIVPIVLALGGYLFTRSENRRAQETANQQRDLDREIAARRTTEDRRVAQERAETDRQIANQRRLDDTLQAYFDVIGQLLLDKDRPLRQSKKGDEVQTLAQARTLTVLPRLDGERKGSVVRFLYESGLITRNRVVVALAGADLRGAALGEQPPHWVTGVTGFTLPWVSTTQIDLREADLSHADLGGTNLRDADLSGTNLREANLNGTKLSGAHLHLANLVGANMTLASLDGATLSGAFLQRADLGSADLSGAELRAAKLRGTNLMIANLSAASVTWEQLEEAKSLERATMPNGQEYEEWLKSKGRGEDDGPS